MEWDEEAFTLSCVARACDHRYYEGVCERCGWEKGSYAKFGAGAAPGDQGEPVSPPFPDPSPGPAPEFFDEEEW